MIDRINIKILYGGNSSEKEISKISATSIYNSFKNDYIDNHAMIWLPMQSPIEVPLKIVWAKKLKKQTRK